MKNFWKGRNLISLLAVAILLIVESCTQQSRAIDSRVFSVFSGFAFVGEGAYHPPTDQTKEINPAVAEHGLNFLPVPPRLEIGKQYIFHHKSPLDVEKLAMVDLPSQLEREGLQIVRVPHSSGEMMELYFGGPLFVIKFKQGNHIGIIFDQPCPQSREQVGKGWDANDYVLVFIR